MVIIVIENIINDIKINVSKPIHSFNVLELAPLVWFDASDPDTITSSGGLVSQWDDKSGNGYDVTQGSAVNQPTLINNTISFDGSNDYLFRSESFMYSENQTVIAFMVLSSSGDDFDRILCERSTSDPDSEYNLIRTGSTSQGTRGAFIIVNDAGTSTGVTNLSGTGFFDNSKHVYMVEDDLSNFTASKDGIYESSVAYSRPTTPITLNRFAIGARVSGVSSGYAEIDVNEIIIFQRDLTLSQKSEINTHLLNKWGV